MSEASKQAANQGKTLVDTPAAGEAVQKGAGTPGAPIADKDAAADSIAASQLTKRESTIRTGQSSGFGPKSASPPSA